MSFTAVYVTFPDQATAEQIAVRMINKKLAACVNIFPITSQYEWKGVNTHEQEFVGILKTIPEHIPALETEITKLHPYEVPCIMRYTVEANPAYEEWIRSMTLK